ncbi:MAG: universal stress protein [Caulobacteraceae bacterium]|nr:universal stress protein [Caulobacteraceae bacterium]
MSWRTLALDLSPSGHSAGILQATDLLADRFDATVLALAALRPVNSVASDGYTAGELIALEREKLTDQLNETQAAFWAQVVPGSPHREWRGCVGFEPPASWIAREARGADVIIAAPPAGGILRGASQVNLADLVMAAGRPVLIAPAEGRALALATAVVAWKDTPETRRALSDSLPLLRACERVLVVTIAPRSGQEAAHAEISQIGDWLARYGVASELQVERAHGDDANRLATIIADMDADVIVAGAYGRSRMREWILGGVTCDFLLNPDRCVLVSH